MFSGIVETTTELMDYKQNDINVVIKVKKPHDFNDLKIGDSIATNGICLTVEAFDEESIQFCLAAETLHITKWNEQALKAKPLNLERSLRLNDRIHGHLVTGHVDAVGRIAERTFEGESLILTVEFPKDLSPYIWAKGSVAINGVSLTINQVTNCRMSFCLIPETLNRTNLSALKVDDAINLEVDNMARGLVRNLQLREELI